MEHKFILKNLFCLFIASVPLNGVAQTFSVSIPTRQEVGAQVLPAEIAPITQAPFAMPSLQRPVFPDRTVDIRDKGARADVPITQVVNAAIAEVSAQGGGTVVVPKGHWKSARLVLKSNVNLHIAEGAVIEFSGKAEDYLPAVFTRHEGVEVMGPAAFIYANGENNIAVTGRGKILGPPMEAEIRKRPNGNSVVENEFSVDTPVAQRVCDGMEGRIFYRPKTISPINCTHVLIEGITMERSVLWNVCPIYCENVILRGFTVNSVEVPSGDGIDIESCKNVLVEYCTLNCGDDCFTLKSGRCDDGLRVNRPTENVVIRYSLAQHGHGGITCGSETAGNIKNVYAHDCVFEGTRSVLRFKTRRNRGGGSESIYYERMRMINIKEAVTWDLLGTEMYVGDLAKRYPPRAVNRLTPTIKDICVKDFVVESAERFLTVNGIPEIPLRNVLIENGTIKCKILTNGLTDVDGLTVRNVSVQSQANKIKVLDGRNILFDGVTFSVPGDKLTVQVEGTLSKDIVFKNSTPDAVVEYSGKSPFTVSVK